MDRRHCLERCSHPIHNAELFLKLIFFTLAVFKQVRECTKFGLSAACYWVAQPPSTADRDWRTWSSPQLQQYLATPSSFDPAAMQTKAPPGLHRRHLGPLRIIFWYFLGRKDVAEHELAPDSPCGVRDAPKQPFWDNNQPWIEDFLCPTPPNHWHGLLVQVGCPRPGLHFSHQGFHLRRRITETSTTIGEYAVHPYITWWISRN